MDADAALQELGSDQIGEAYVTATVTVWDDDPRVADEKLRLVEKMIQGRDFTCMAETVNAVEAWLGSLARPCLCQRPATTGLDPQSRAYDSAVGGLGRRGEGPSLRGTASVVRQKPRVRRRSDFRSMSAMSAIRWWLVRPALANRCCWR